MVLQNMKCSVVFHQSISEPFQIQTSKKGNYWLFCLNISLYRHNYFENVVPVPHVI